MNFNQFETQGLKMNDQVKAKWSKLSDEEITKTSGKKDQLAGKVQEHYSLSKMDAQKQVDEWITALPAVSSNVVATAGSTPSATPATPMVETTKPAVPHV